VSDFIVRINRREGSLEISGEDKSWVDGKLTQLEYVYKEVPAVVAVPASIAAQQPVAVGVSTTKAGGTTKVAEPRTTRKASGGKRPEINDELKDKLTREVIAKLNSFIAERDKAYNSSMTAQAIIIAIFLEDELNWKGVDKHDLFTVYRQLGTASGNTDAQLRNAYARNHYFSHIEAGKYMPSGSGDTFARHGSRNG
jgi:hypothetical protein